MTVKKLLIAISGPLVNFLLVFLFFLFNGKIFGIEKDEETMSQTELELENTANYEKLDEEIKKTNEFLMTLRELQKKLD